MKAPEVKVTTSRTQGLYINLLQCLGVVYADLCPMENSKLQVLKHRVCIRSLTLMMKSKKVKIMMNTTVVNNPSNHCTSTKEINRMRVWL